MIGGPDPAAEPLHDPVTDRQAKPQALAHLLCGEEWVENPRHHVFSNVLGGWEVELVRKGASGWVKEAVSRGSGARSLALDASGRPHLAFWSERNLQYAHRPPTGSGFVLETVDTSGSTDPAEGNLALDPDGAPRIVYRHHATWDEVRLATARTCP